MKFSEINFEVVKDYIVCIDDEDRKEIEMYINAAKSYVRTQTGLTDEQIDQYEYFSIPTLMLISTFFESKTITIDKKVNPLFKDMLSLGMIHSL